MSGMNEEICENCGGEISRSEQAYVFHGMIVCGECDKKLRGTAQVAATHTSSQAERQESELVKERARSTWRQRAHVHETKSRNPLGIFGTMVGALIFFIVIVPLMRVTCDEITSPVRGKKVHKKTTTRIVDQPIEKRGGVPIDQSAQKEERTTADRPVKGWRRATADRLAKKRQKTPLGLPADGVYSTDAGTGGSYKDPINGYFEVQPPVGFRVRERRDKSKFTITSGSSHVGEVVPSSFIQFISPKKVYIAVTARKTFTTIEHDFEFVLNGLPKRFSGIRIHRSRFVTIDGVKGGEILASWHTQQMLMVKYKKHGLDHTITINCDAADFSKFQVEFLSFLRSYRSLQPK